MDRQRFVRERKKANDTIKTIDVDKMVGRQLNNDPADKYLPLEICIDEPRLEVNENNIAYARPFEFDNDKATRFAATCPACGQGIYFSTHDIVIKFGSRFVACEGCGLGRIAPAIPDWEDPFINPIKHGRMTDDKLDTSIANIAHAIKDDGLTVADRIGNLLCQEESF